MIEIRMEDIEAHFDQVEALLDENERLREELSEEMLESGQLTIERDAARSELAAARRVVQAVEDLTTEAECRAGYLTAPGWREKAVKTSDLRAALAGPGPTPEPPSTIEIGGQVMTEAQYNAARYPLIDANPGLVIPNDAMSVEFGPGPTDDERPATTREVGSGPTNPLPKGADDE